jgi:hypothetical protein
MYINDRRAETDADADLVALGLVALDLVALDPVALGLLLGHNRFRENTYVDGYNILSVLRICYQLQLKLFGVDPTLPIRKTVHIF